MGKERTRVSEEGADGGTSRPAPLGPVDGGEGVGPSLEERNRKWENEEEERGWEEERVGGLGCI